MIFFGHWEKEFRLMFRKQQHASLFSSSDVMVIEYVKDSAPSMKQFDVNFHTI